MVALANMRTLSIRAARLSLRNPESLITALALPVILMLMFVYLFGGAIRTGSSHYIDFVLPGVLLVCAGFGISSTAVNVRLVCSASGAVASAATYDSSTPAYSSGSSTAARPRRAAPAKGAPRFLK